MSTKKRKRTNKEIDIYNSDELRNLGIYEDDDVEEEIDEKEVWRYYG